MKQEPNALLSMIHRCAPDGSLQVVGVAVMSLHKGTVNLRGLAQCFCDWIVWPAGFDADPVFVTSTSWAPSCGTDAREDDDPACKRLSAILHGFRSPDEFRLICGVRIGVWELSVPKEVILMDDNIEGLARHLIPELLPYVWFTEVARSDDHDEV